MSVRVLHGDCLELLPTLSGLDAVITDPPYHLTSIVERFGKRNSAPAQYGKDGAFSRVSKGFMSQTWDGGDIAFNVETWRLVYDALKPGAHLVAFGGTRTFHRMACAIEDAGFEIRDTLMWLYGSGFPKSHNVAIGIDKQLAGVGPRGQGFNTAGQNVQLNQNRELRSDHPDYKSYACATPEALKWQGWGTALKPAWEPIILARKPLSEGTVAANVLAHGTGAINIDGCRIEANDGQNRARPPRTANEILGGGKGTNLTASPHNDAGRWPANVLHDGSDEVEAAFAAFGESKSTPGAKQTAKQGTAAYGNFAGTDAIVGHADSGTASRFFYCAKASKADRAGSKHPTVKPQALMRWLCRLVTPPGGTILDCFAGSGSTGAAAMREGFNAVLIEREAEYCDDIRRRIEQVESEATTIISSAQMDMFA